MDYLTLGRTGMTVSRLGLGCGGHSRLGLSAGRDEHESVAIVRLALELGVNFIDTAEGYGTEQIVGQGIRGVDRGKIVLSSKKGMAGERPVTPADLRIALEQSLGRLGTDYLDVYHLHGLRISQYDRALETLIPQLLKLKDQGKIRAIGVTEAFITDPGHTMLRRAVEDNCWDVIMVGFNILNQSARDRVLAAAREKNIGVLCMFAVRTALSQPKKLRNLVRELLNSGKLNDAASIDLNDPLAFVRRDDAAHNIVEAAYRFCRDEAGIHVVLSGTGKAEHLHENVTAMSGPPLPLDVRGRLIQIFRDVDTVTGE